MSASLFGQSPRDPISGGFAIEQRVRYYVHRTYSWQRMALLGLDTAVDHVLAEPREWGRSPAGFTYRYSSGFGRRVVRNSIEFAAGTVLKEDTRFVQSQQQTFLKRLQFASTNAFLARDVYGGRKFAYSRLAATVGGILIISTWHPCRRSPEHLLQGIGSGYLGHLQNSLLTEFSPDMIRLGKRVRSKILGKVKGI